MADENLSIFNNTLPSTATATTTDYDTATTTLSGLPSYINVTISNGALLNGVYDAWCINSNFNTIRGTYNNASIYPSYGVIPSGILQSGQQTPNPSSPDPYLDKLQQINWILNNITEASNVVGNKYHYNGVDYTWGDVQLAIWKLLGDTLDSADLNSLEVYSQQNANNLVSLAQANGSNFVPVAGQDFGVIVKAAGQQPLILELKTAGLGDFVWEDLNANGIQDTNESGINGATVTLLDANGGVLGTTLTGDNPNTPQVESGYYQFGPLLPGTYQVQFTLPTGFSTVSPYLQGSNTALDSNANPVNNLIFKPITLVGGQVNTTIDAGFYKFASVGDFVWEDKNGNGIQDAGESGIAGVNVTLTGAGADGVIGTADDTSVTTTTDAAGQYSFSGLTPGNYQVTFNQPTGYNFTTQNTGGDDAVDSDADATTGKSQTFTLISGETNTTIDAGLYKPASVGDFVWEDKNVNGVQDAGESGIAGVNVTLTGAGADGVIGTADDTSVTTTTDAAGQYSFSGLT
ncbi:MAG TPA: SdrD B-like domain-containing protein, partial [Nostocaceae cyanobacterium]|nr:SdrD B-like domain-containing protein [Nostocaceae cyanobacterium]